MINTLILLQYHDLISEITLLESFIDSCEMRVILNVWWWALISSLGLVDFLWLDSHKVRCDINHKLSHILCDAEPVYHLEQIDQVIAHYASAKRKHELADLSGYILGTFEVLSVIQEVYNFFDIVSDKCLVSVYLYHLWDLDVLFELLKWQYKWLFVQEVLFENWGNKFSYLWILIQLFLEPSMVKECKKRLVQFEDAVKGWYSRNSASAAANRGERRGLEKLLFQDSER